MKNLTKRKGMSLKDIYYAAYILDPKINVQGLSTEKRIKKKTEFFDKVATRNLGTENSAQ